MSCWNQFISCNKIIFELSTATLDQLIIYVYRVHVIPLAFNETTPRDRFCSNVWRKTQYIEHKATS